MSSWLSGSSLAWCGITPQRGQPNVSGVADVMIERDDGVKLVVGEVNPVSSAGGKEGGPGEFQLLAELRMLQPRQKVVGVLVNPSMMFIYMPNSTRKSDFKYNYVTRDIRDLESVLDGLGIIFEYLTSNSVPPPIDAAPSLPQLLQTMFQEFSLDVTTRLDEFSGRQDEFSARLDAVEELEEAVRESPVVPNWINQSLENSKQWHKRRSDPKKSLPAPLENRRRCCFALQ